MELGRLPIELERDLHDRGIEDTLTPIMEMFHFICLMNPKPKEPDK